LGVLVLPVVIVAAWYYYKSGNMSIKAVPVIALGFIIGGFFGSKFALSLPEATIKKIFAILMILIAIKMLFIDKPIEESTTVQKNNIQKT
jgi:hypothetical protein